MTKLGLSYILFVVIVLFSCKAQTTDKVNLDKLIFHLSRCNGTCPRIGLEIDSSKSIYVDREYFRTKSETDSTYSGQFKGTLTENQYNKLIELLQDCDLRTLTFANSDVMDLPEITIIAYYNGQRKYLKSAEPPNSAKDLISFLTLLGDSKILEKTNKPKNIEE